MRNSVMIQTTDIDFFRDQLLSKTKEAEKEPDFVRWIDPPYYHVQYIGDGKVMYVAIYTAETKG